MGYRTVVILYNDQAHEWTSDPELGKKINRAMSRVTDITPTAGGMGATIGYGAVVECVHADSETLAMIESYSYHPMAYGAWHTRKTTLEAKIGLLEKAANQLGYRLSKIPGALHPELTLNTNSDGHDI